MAARAAAQQRSADRRATAEQLQAERHEADKKRAAAVEQRRAAVEQRRVAAEERRRAKQASAYLDVSFEPGLMGISCDVASGTVSTSA